MNPTVLITWSIIKGVWQGQSHAVSRSKINLFGKPPQGFQGGAWLCCLVNSRRYGFLASQGILEAKLIRPCKGQRSKTDIDQALAEAKEALKKLPTFGRDEHETASGFKVYTEICGYHQSLVRTWKIFSVDGSGNLTFQRVDKVILAQGVCQRQDGEFEVNDLEQTIQGLGNPSVSRDAEDHFTAEWRDEAGNTFRAHVPQSALFRLAQSVALKSIDRIDGISVYGTLLLDGTFEIQTRLCQGEWTFERNKVRPATFEAVTERLSKEEREQLVRFLRENGLVVPLSGYQAEEVRDSFNRLVNVMSIVRRSMDVERPNRFVLERMRKRLMDVHERFMEVFQDQTEYVYGTDPDPEIYGCAANDSDAYAHYAPLVTMAYNQGLESLGALIEQLRPPTSFAAAAE